MELLTRGGNTDEIDAIRDDLMEALSEMQDAKILLKDATRNHNLSMRREQEYIARIDQLTNQVNHLTSEREDKQHLLEQIEMFKDEVASQAKQRTELSAKNQRIELDKETLEEELTTLMEEKDNLELKYEDLVGEYDKSVKLLEPIFTSKCLR